MIDWALDRAEILRYLGYRGQALSPELTEQLDRCQAAVCAAAEPRTVYRLLSPEEVPPELLQGQDIKAHLAGSETICLMAATLGAPLEELLMRTQVRNVSDAVIMDASASAAIESVCDRWEAALRRELEARGLGLSGRFSPGYGDLPLSVQPLFLRTVDAGRRIGLRVTGSGLLTPRKSVTALLAVRPGPATGKKRRCESCSRYPDCPYSLMAQI